MAIGNGAATRLLGIGVLGAGLGLQVLAGPAVAWASDDAADGPSAAAAPEAKASEPSRTAEATEPSTSKDVAEEPVSKTNADPEPSADPEPGADPEPSADPESSDALMKLGNAYYACNDKPEAVNAYRRAVTIEDAPADAHYLLARVLMDVGDSLEAAIQFKIYTQMEPKGEFASDALDALSGLRGDWPV